MTPSTQEHCGQKLYKMKTSNLTSLQQLTIAVLVLSSLTASSAAADGSHSTPLSSATRALQQAAMSNSTTPSQAVNPLGRLPSEDLPNGLESMQVPAGLVTVSLAFRGVTADQFVSSYQATVATITGTISGTPAARWQFTVGDGSAASNATGSILGNGTQAGATVTPSNTTLNATQQLSANATNSTISTISANSTNISSDSNSTSSSAIEGSSNSTSGSESESSSGSRKLLHSSRLIDAAMQDVVEVRIRQLLQLNDLLRVSLSITTTRPQVVVYRLSQSSTAGAAAAAAALMNNCATEYCSRLIAAGLPVDSSSIQVTPGITTWVADPSVLSSQARAQEAQAARGRVIGGVIGGVFGGLSCLGLSGYFSWRKWMSRRVKPSPSLLKSDSASETYMSPQERELRGWKSMTPGYDSRGMQLTSLNRLSNGHDHCNGVAKTPGKGSPDDVCYGITPQRSGTQESMPADTPTSIQLAALAAAAAKAAAQKPSGSGVHPTPYSTGNQQSPAMLGRVNSGGGMPYPRQILPGMYGATGLQTPTPWPTVLSTYGTPGVYGTPELAPDPNFSMVSPEQLNHALQSYWASVQHLQGLIAGSTQTTPRMTPQHTPGYLTPQRSLTRSPKKSPLPSPRKPSPLGSPRVMSPLRSKAAGYEALN